MRRAELWVLWRDLCAAHPAGVEVCWEFPFWVCRVRLPTGVRTGTARTIEGAVEVVATNLAREAAA